MLRPHLVALLLVGCHGEVNTTRPVVHAPKIVKVVVAPPPVSVGSAMVVQHEAVLRLDEPAGLEIGRAFAGARVRVSRMDGASALVVVPEFERPVHAEGGGVTMVPLEAWIDTSALGTHDVPLVEPAPKGRTVRDFYERVTARRGELGFFETRCGPLQVLEQGDRTTRVAQRAGGVELVGWSETQIVGSRGDNRCPARVAEDGVPAGFVEAKSVDVSQVLRADRTVHWLGETASGAYVCEDWHVTKGGELRHVGRANGERVETDYTIEREGSRVVLLGPTIHRGARADGFGCGDDYRAVDLDDERLVLVPHARSWRISAYHPDDTEVWYLTESACKAAAARASSPEPSATASLAPVHSGC